MTSSHTHGGRRNLPYAFTEHGALMAANVLNSPAAITMSVQVIRAFVQLRQLLINHKAPAAKLAELESRVGAHDTRLAAIIDRHPQSRRAKRSAPSPKDRIPYDRFAISRSA